MNDTVPRWITFSTMSFVKGDTKSVSTFERKLIVRLKPFLRRLLVELVRVELVDGVGGAVVIPEIFRAFDREAHFRCIFAVISTVEPNVYTELALIGALVAGL